MKRKRTSGLNWGTDDVVRFTILTPEKAHHDAFTVPRLSMAEMWHRIEANVAAVIGHRKVIAVTIQYDKGAEP